MKILIAEDEKPLAKALTTVLEHNGYEVTAAYNGAEAQKYALDASYDCYVFDIMMPVKDMAALNGLAPDMKALSDLSAAYNVTGVHAFTLSEPDGVHCRNFAPLYDIDEEAATGTSNGALTYYLYKRGIVKAEQDNLFIQGEAMDRPSKISSRLSLKEDGSVKIRVGGVAAILAEGEIYL